MGVDSHVLRHLPISLLLLVAGPACVTPSVPIPPPSPEDISFEADPADDTAVLSYEPDPSYGGAVVYVFNRTQGEGVITTAGSDGSVSATPPFPAIDNDEIVVTFEVEAQLASTCVRFADGRSSSDRECDR